MSPSRSLLAALMLLPLLTSAQFNYNAGDNIPDCATTCLYSYIKEGSTCLTSTDLSCICTAYNFLEPVAQCMYVSCTPEDAKSVWDSTKRDCIAFKKPLPDGAPEIWIGGLGDAEPSGTVDEPFPSNGAESSDTPRTSGTRGGSGGGGNGSGSNEKSGMSTAAIIGIVVGAVLVVAIIAIAAICITRSRNRKKISAAAAAAASVSRPSNNDGPPGGGRPNAPPAFATAGKPTYNPHQQPLMQHDHLAQQQQGYAGGGAYYHGDPEKNGAAFVGVAPVPTASPQPQHQHAMYTPPHQNQAYQPQPHQHQHQHQYQPQQPHNGAFEMGSGYQRPPSVPSTGGTVAPPPPPQMFPPRPQVEQIQPQHQQLHRGEGMHELPPAEDVVRAEMMGTVPEGPAVKKGTGLGLFGRNK